MKKYAGEVMIMSNESKDIKCIVCGKTGGELCFNCMSMTEDFERLRKWVNNSENADEKLVYLLDVCINDRLMYIINDVNFKNGKMIPIGYIGKPKVTERVEKIIGEIKSLRDAKEMMKNAMVVK